MRTRHLILTCALLALTTLGIIPANHWELLAQADCGFATTVEYPIDTSLYKMVQDYGVPSPRHQGRYHTGEDWHLARGQSAGQPVKAIAAGRVTYSYPLGWGRDGGAVIIEHLFADGTKVYSQYGHMMETETIKFPARLSCVQAGQVIGAIGDVRPAPHLHFEIRVSNADTAGPGYSWAYPYEEGWRNPSQFILNRQLAQHPAYLWQLTTLSGQGFAAPPLQLSDNSLMYLDGSQLRLATYDGRVLWRVRLDAPAAALVTDTGAPERWPLLVYPDGRAQQVDYQGAALSSWRLDALPGMPLATMDDNALLVYTRDSTLTQIAPNRREVDWTLPEMPLPMQVQVARDVIGLMSDSAELLTVSRDGQVLDRAQLRDSAGMTTAPDGRLLVFSRGGLWSVDSAGTWTLAKESARAVNGSSAVLADAAGQIFAYDGVILRAYAPNNDAELWALPLVLSGRTTMSQLESKLLMISTHGQIVVADTSGRLCSALQMYGDDRARVWYQLGQDNVLRIALGDHAVGLDWRALTRPCAA